jgi:hypothetical protein
MEKKRIGEFLVERGVIEPNQVTQILNHSEKSGLRFIKAGLEMEILDRDKLIQAFAPKTKAKWFNLDPKHLTQAPKNIITPQDMVRYGAVPLGFKKEARFMRPSRRKHLVLGLLDPKSSKETIEALGSHISDVQFQRDMSRSVVYLVLIDQFLELLDTVFGFKEEDIRRLPASEICPVVKEFLMIDASPQARLKLVA